MNSEGTNGAASEVPRMLLFEGKGRESQLSQINLPLNRHYMIQYLNIKVQLFMNHHQDLQAHAL